MNDDNMAGGGVEKRKELSDVTSSEPRKRTKVSASKSKPKSKIAQHVDIGDESEKRNPSVVPANLESALTNLKNTYDAERAEYEREIKELDASLMARDDDVEKWRRKYKHDLKDMVEQKTAAAEKRVTQAEDQLKKIKKQAKEDVVAIRAELISAATEAVTAKNPHSNQSPQQLFTEAEIVLKRLRNQSPKRYSELMKDQPDFGLLAARSMATGHAMQQRSIGEDVNSRDVSVSMPGNAVAVTKEALRTLEMDLMSASEDMRTNSTLANQKKTLCKKMTKALKEVEPIFLEHAELVQTNPGVKFETTRSPAPTADAATLQRKNQQLQFTINDLSIKLKDVRGKLEEEVQMRRKRESQLA